MFKTELFSTLFSIPKNGFANGLVILCLDKHFSFQTIKTYIFFIFSFLFHRIGMPPNSTTQEIQGLNYINLKFDYDMDSKFVRLFPLFFFVGYVFIIGVFIRIIIFLKVKNNELTILQTKIV